MDTSRLHYHKKEEILQVSIPSNVDSGDFLRLQQKGDFNPQLKLFGDNIQITCSETEIALHTVSEDTGKMTAKIKIDDLTSFEIEEDMDKFQARVKSSGGRSGAFFYFTGDNEFVIKTITSEELVILIEAVAACPDEGVGTDIPIIYEEVFS